MSPREQCEHGYAVADCATCWKSVPGALGDTCDWGACTATATRLVRMTHGIAPEQRANAPVRPLCDADAAFVVSAMGGVDLGAVPPPAPPAPPRLAGLSPDAVRALAREHGWTTISVDGTQFTVRRSYLFSTPERVLCDDETFRRRPFGRWNEPTYSRHEFLTFSFTGSPGRWRLAGAVVYGDAAAPWVGRTDFTIPQRRAAEILTAAPPAEAISEPTPLAAGGGK